MSEHREQKTQQTKNEVKVRKRRSKRAKILVSLLSLLGLTGIGVDSFLDDPNNLIKVKEALASPEANIFHGNELGYPKTSEFLALFDEDITKLSTKYDIPKEALYYLAYKEIGEDDANTPLGLGTNVLQHWKAARNSVISDLKETPGDWTPDGKYHIGLSHGLLNLKPGLFTRKVIEHIQNEELKKALLDSYDDTLHHPDENTFDDITNDFSKALELAACHMSLWYEKLKNSGLSQDEIIAILIEANTSFPYDFRDGHWGNWMYEKYPEFSPELRDKK